MTQHTTVQTWIHNSERLWRTPGTDALTALFTTDATYKTSPWAQPIVGFAVPGPGAGVRHALRQLWTRD